MWNFSRFWVQKIERKRENFPGIILSIFSLSSLIGFSSSAVPFRLKFMFIISISFFSWKKIEINEREKLFLKLKLKAAFRNKLVSIWFVFSFKMKRKSRKMALGHDIKPSPIFTFINDDEMFHQKLPNRRFFGSWKFQHMFCPHHPAYPLCLTREKKLQNNTTKKRRKMRNNVLW